MASTAYSQLKFVVAKVHSAFLASRQTRVYSRVRSAAKSLSPFVRSRHHRLALELEIESAQKIQRCFRSCLFVRHFRSQIAVDIDEWINYCSQRIQKVIRGFLARRRFKKLIQEIQQEKRKEYCSS